MSSQIRPLTQEERQNALHAAQDAVLRAIGPRPEREQFTHYTNTKYPTSVTRLITLLCLILLLAAFTPSAIRLYVIGSKTFGEAIDNTAATQLVGLATVLSAETGQIVFNLALATLGTTRSSRRLLYTSALIATLIALVGNIQVALPGNAQSPFAWLEAITPPILVLSTAYVLKGQMLDAIQQRHANEQAYQQALETWMQSTSNPEIHPRWHQFHANAIRDTLRKCNSRRKETLEMLTIADWRQLVFREQQADAWYETPVKIQICEEQTVPLAVTTSSNGNGQHSDYKN